MGDLCASKNISLCVSGLVGRSPCRWCWAQCLEVHLQPTTIVIGLELCWCAQIPTVLDRDRGSAMKREPHEDGPLGGSESHGGVPGRLPPLPGGVPGGLPGCHAGRPTAKRSRPSLPEVSPRGRLLQVADPRLCRHAPQISVVNIWTPDVPRPGEGHHQVRRRMALIAKARQSEHFDQFMADWHWLDAKR